MATVATKELEADPTVPDPAAQPVPEWAIDFREADNWRQASGEVLADMILQRVKVMQALEASSSPAGWAQLMLSIGVLAWTKRGYDVYKAARRTGQSRLVAVTESVKQTESEQRAYLATVLPALRASLLEERPNVFMVLVNRTDGLLEAQDLTVTGKQTVQFVEPSETRKALLPRDHTEGLPPEDEAFWLGLFCARKRDMALHGTQGAFSLKPSDKAFPNNVFVGWEVPATSTFGGPNRCLVSATFEGSVEAFSKETDRHGSLDSQSTAGRGLVRARMNSGAARGAYMSVVFDTV
jgi:hypothetical protein